MTLCLGMSCTLHCRYLILCHDSAMQHNLKGKLDSQKQLSGHTQQSGKWKVTFLKKYVRRV